MNVLHVCSYFLGTQLYQNFVDVLNQNQINNRVYVPAPQGASANFTLGADVDVSYCLNKYDRLWFHYKHNKIMRDLYAKYNPGEFDIIHAHSLFSNGYVAWKINEKYHVPYIVAVRNTDINLFFARMAHLRGMGINILDKAQRIVFLSPVYREQLLQKYVPAHLQQEFSDKSAVLPNGIDKYWLNSKNSPRSLSDKHKLKIIAVGNVNKSKNQLTTLKVCQELQSRGYQVEFSVVGRIIDRAIHAKLVKEKMVQYIPHQPREELIKILRQNDILIMPSLAETFGLVYAEAMSQGLPVIYSQGQGFDQQFSDGAVGFGVNCFNIKEIAEKALKITEDYDEISARCIALVNKFDWNTIAEKYIDIYAEVKAQPHLNRLN